MKAAIIDLGLAVGKSMRAYESTGIEALHIDRDGLFGDRHCMWVEAEQHTQVLYKPGKFDEPGTFLSQREDPVLTSIKPSMTSEGLLLNSNGSGSLLVPAAEDSNSNRLLVSVWGWSGEAVDRAMKPPNGVKNELAGRSDW